MKKMFIFVMLGVWFSTGCAHDIPLGPNTHTTVDVGNGGNFLNETKFCSSIYEGTVRGLEVDITVDVVEQDGSMVNNYWTGRLHLNNDDYDPGQWTLSVQDFLQVPETGFYIVTVSCEAEECFDCCDGSSCISSWGEPKWRGGSLVINADAPPPNIPIAMPYVACY